MTQPQELLQHNRKFVEVYSVPEKFEISTPQGWKPIKHVMKTVPYDVWYIKLENGDELKGADTHILYTENHTPIYLNEIKVDQLIETDNGYSKCIELKKLDVPPEHMFDIEVDSVEHEFYSNGFVSHNTTCSSVFMLWFACFQKDKTIAILANKASTAKKILDEIKFAYEHLPEYIKPGVVEYNAFSIEFDNGCNIIAAATSPDSIRGRALALLYMDEFAFVTPPSLAEDFWTSTFPTISTGGRCIIVSTPNGTGNKFYTLWKDAEDKTNPFKTVKVTWDRVPGRGPEWKDEMEKALGKIKFAQEHACAFQGSSHTLIDADFLVNKLKPIEPQYVPDNETKMWDVVQPNRKYALAVDTAGGVGSDFSVINVFDITDYYIGGGALQVATWRCSTMTPKKFAEIVHTSAKYWNNAYVVCEINGLGNEVNSRLFNDFEYENLFFDQEKNAYGVYSSKETKPKAAMLFKDDLESGRIILQDSQTIMEIGYFEEVSKDVFKAKDSRTLHDDTVMTCLWLAYFLHSPFFEGEMDEHKKKTLKKTDPEEYYKQSGTTPEDDSLTEEEEAEDEEVLSAFIDEDNYDENTWLERSVVNDFIEEKRQRGELDKYIQQQRDFHTKKDSKKPGNILRRR